MARTLRKLSIGIWGVSPFGITAAIVAVLGVRSCSASAGKVTQPVVYGSVVLAPTGGSFDSRFVLSDSSGSIPVVVAAHDYSTVKLAASAFAKDEEEVTSRPAKVLEDPATTSAKHIILIGTVGHSALIDQLRSDGQIDTSAIDGKWEAAITTVVAHPFRGITSALVIAGSDRRGTAYAVFDLSRQIGVSPWYWWADVPVRHRGTIEVKPGTYIQASPSVQYRGIFLNDEDWGLRPWAARKMDPALHNIGPHTYARIFELLLRLRANTLWPAMHPRTLPFNSVRENAVLADQWGIVMGSSHSEALLRNNVGEWNEKRDGPWNYQLNSEAINKYWDDRLQTNGKFDNFYTVGMRGVHDSGLEATGSVQVKARLVERIVAEQQRLLAERVNPNVNQIPQVLWLYKESLDLYRVGMKVPDDVTLGWTDDNFGYIRQLPNAQEQTRPGGSALYYHVSYFGDPHDYLWLSSTPPAVMREELAKAWHHGVRRLWVLNVGDLKPAETDIDYFLRMAWDEPATERTTQMEFLKQWNREQFPSQEAVNIAGLMNRYYELTFVRKPEFMGFNDNGRPIQRTAWNPNAWGDQNWEQLSHWRKLDAEAAALDHRLPAQYRDAYFELAEYPIEAAAAQSEKFMWSDRSYLDASRGNKTQAQDDASNAFSAYKRIQSLTWRYNSLAGGKWDGIMSDAPRALRAFDMPLTPAQSMDSGSLPKQWTGPQSEQTDPSDIKAPSHTAADFDEVCRTVSMDAAHFKTAHNGSVASWHVRPELGLPGGSVFFGDPGTTPAAQWVGAGNSDASQDPWIDYEFMSSTAGDATISIYLLPTFPVDSKHRLRYAVSVDGEAPIPLDAAGTEEQRAGVSPWSSNVLSNAEVQTLSLKDLRPGKHSLRLIYGDPGVIFQHVLITFPGSPPGYPFPPETHSHELSGCVAR